MRIGGGAMVEAAPAAGSLGPYRLKRRIGSGGMGTVYFAEEVDGGPVALKVVHPHLMARPGFFHRLQREAEAGRRVVHENVVRMLRAELQVVDGAVRCFLVMEYVEGQSLRALLKELGAVPEALVREIARQLAAGLEAIHAAGVIHRDLKPENVLITADQRVRIIDLGVARLHDTRETQGSAPAFAGSILYAAPEQLRRTRVGPGADLYALGVILHELLSGRHPFPSEDASGAIHGHLEERPPRLAEVAPDVSPFLSEVVSVLLEKEPGRRFDSATALRRVLEEGEASAWWAGRQASMRERADALPRVPVSREARLRGREGDLAVLRELWARAKEGSGCALLLEGEAGIGKSRLIHAFLEDFRYEDAHVLYGAYAPSGGPGAVTAALRTKFGSANLVDAVRPYLRRAPELLPPLAGLAGIDEPPSGEVCAESDVLRAVALELMGALAAEKPLLWIVEDLQFANAERRRLLVDVVRAAEGRRMLLILTSRPGGVAADAAAQFNGAGALRRMALGRLGVREVALLLADAFGNARLAEHLAPRIALESDGIPFLVLEIARELKDGERLVRAPDGAWGEARAIGEIEVPPAVRDLIAGRLRGLTARERALLDLGSVEGHEFAPGLLAGALGRPAVAVLQDLARIERREGVVRASGDRYRFDHHQVHEAVYADLAPSVRAAYHLLLGQVLERRAGAAQDDPADVDGALCADLCHHFTRGGMPVRAARYADRALAHLERTCRSEEAVRVAEAMLATPGAVAGRERLRILLRVLKPLARLGREGRRLEAAEEAAGLASALGEAEWEAAARSHAESARQALAESA